MNKNFLFLILGLALVALAGCSGSGDEPYREELVLQGYMYLGQPLKVRITRTVPMGSFYDSSAIGVTGATGYMTAGADTFALVEEPNSGYYHIADTTVRVMAGQAYSIRAEVDGRVITAAMRAAGAVEIVSTGPDTVEFGGETYYTVGWSHDSLATGYAVLIDNIEPNWADEDMQVSGNNGPDMWPFNVYVAHAQEESVAVGWVFVGFKGRHRVRVLSCDEAAWNYFWTYMPLTTDYMPVSNVQGALGIFAAGGVDTTYFFLQDEVSDGPNNDG